MDRYNQIQKDLVRICEEAHYHGLRHKGLSGTICEDALMGQLRLAAPEFKFDRGVIKFGKNIGEDLDVEDLTTQIDIIIYKGNPIYESQKHVVVNASDVLGVIEVKKWSHPKKLKPEEKMTINLLEIKKQFKDKLNKNLGLFFVSFRFHDRKIKDVGWFTESEQLPFNAYCFFGTYSSVRGRNNYPWEEGERWEKFDDILLNPYSGQFANLVEQVAKL